MPRPKNMKIWKHFHSLTDNSVKCTKFFCGTIYRVPNSLKMKNHLLKCRKCPLVIRDELSENRGEGGETTISNFMSSPNSERPVLESPNLNEDTIQIEFTEEKNRLLMKLLCKAIYVTGSPLSMVEHPLWKEFFNELQPQFTLPTRKAVSTTYLDEIYNEMEREITEELKSLNNLHLQCDGWSNPRNEGVINFVIAKPEPVFVKSVATGCHRHTAEYLKQEIQKVMETYGPNKFVTLIGDNTKNLQKAFDLVKLQHTHVNTLNCAAHTLNLLCHDILKEESINGFINIGIDTIKAIRRNQILNTLLKRIISEKRCWEQLKLPSKTRWGSYYHSMRSLRNSKAALQCLAVHEEAVAMPSDIKTNLLNERFWGMVEEVTKLLEPIADNIFKLEGNKTFINDVYMAFKDIKSRILFLLPHCTRLIDNNISRRILDAVETRRNNTIKPIHLAAYMLDPKSQGLELNENEEISAMDFIHERGRRLNLDVMTDLANYRARQGFWGKGFVWTSLEKMSALTWWKGICKNKQLSVVATSVLSAPSTSVATETTFSVHGRIHNAKRSRLTIVRAVKLAYISYNWNLLHGQQDDDDREEFEEDPFSSSLIESPVTVQTTEREPQPSSSGIGTTYVEFLDIDRFSSNSDSDC